MTVVQNDVTNTADTAGGEEPSCYVINLYTWIRDEGEALDLAVRVAELVSSLPEVDEQATTVSDENDPTAEPVRALLHLVKAPAERIPG